MNPKVSGLTNEFEPVPLDHALLGHLMFAVGF